VKLVIAPVEADKIIEQGRVTINGIVPELGTKFLLMTKYVLMEN
jgi:hypothetical protein